MKAKSFNSQIFLEFLCYCFFGWVMLLLVRSGKYLSYVTPRMKPYLYFTAIVMLIWASVSFFRIFRPQYKVRSSHCFVLVIPILLILLPHRTLGASDLSAQINQYNTVQKQIPSADSNINDTANIPADNPAENIAEPEEDMLPADSVGDTVPDMQTGVPYEYYSPDLSGLDEANKKITVSNDDFGVWVPEIYMNMEKYEGYTIVITGFVFKDSEMLKENEFVPGRLMMTCCVADLSLAGILCKYDEVSQLEQDSWVTVEGTIFIEEFEYDGQKYIEPQIEVTKITPAEEVKGYVYPY